MKLFGPMAALGRPFSLLLVSDALMLLSLMVGHVAVPWWIAHEGGAAHLALYASVIAAASFVALPLLSPLGDRYSKRTLIAGSLAAMLIEAVVLAALAQAGLYRIGAIIALELIAVVAMAVINPVSLSIAADLLPPEKLSDGLAYQKSAQSIGRLIGPVLGGGVLALWDTPAALWLHALLLVVACALATRIVAPAHQAHAASAARWVADLRAGLAAKWHIPMERGWTFVSFLVMIFFTPGIGLLVPLKVKSLGLSGAWLGACEAALSAGLLAGALGTSSWIARIAGRFNASFGAILCEGLCLMALGWTRQPVVMVGTLALFGLCVLTVQIVGHTHRMLAIPQAFRARMTAVNMMVMQVSGVIGAGLAGAALGMLDVDGVYLLFGASLFLVGLGYTRVPGYRGFLNLTHGQAQGHYERTHPRLFSP